MVRARKDWAGRRTMGPASWSGVALARGSRVVLGVLVVAVCLVSSDVASAAQWSVQLAPTPAGSSAISLSDISCTSGKACTAVGYAIPAGGGQTALPLVERWNGSGWSIQQTPPLPGGWFYQFRGVSCTSRKACVAVGGAQMENVTVPLVERWNGERWSIERLSRRVGPLVAVSCTSRRACAAVGLDGFWAHLTGDRWSVHKRRSGDAEDVSCLSAAVCTQVGSTGGAYGNFAARWNGLSWHRQHVPTPDPYDYADTLLGVSCTSARACMAVGLSECGNCFPFATAERWDGTRWSAAKPRNPDVFGGSDELTDVSCVSATVCIAVGGGFTLHMGDLLAERWTGTEWVFQPAPEPVMATGASCSTAFACSGLLSGVSCTSAAACIAVGSVTYTDPSTMNQTGTAIFARYS